MDENTADTFESSRRFLLGVAYRMLGSVTEAEDIVQEAYLRWHRTDHTAVENPRSFLAKTVTNLCLDHLKSARVQRENYVGTWLPEPIVQNDPVSSLDGDLSVALLMALERLSPLERAAFLLHDIFDVSFPEIALLLEKSEAGCRQLASRAREHVHASRPRYPVTAEEGSQIVDAFFQASRSGDTATLESILAENVILYSDGGGIRKAALNPVYGRDKNLRFFEGLVRQYGQLPTKILYRGLINNLPGLITLEADGALQSAAFEIENGVIQTIYVVRNPHKLTHVKI